MSMSEIFAVPDTFRLDMFARVMFAVGAIIMDVNSPMDAVCATRSSVIMFVVVTSVVVMALAPVAVKFVVLSSMHSIVWPVTRPVNVVRPATWS
jgi:hypothetical protein